ncbi:hypothetical protein [aff. Roholtiella sp. LEGE 12411]|uniref:hypothetical protein n=1 Tax=aff. Roholtiella sp. LEGE 12411 TaxID=1828822 RepID=UPI00188045F0|nr:hypothetical protein [aff. Roholtiella sp. LEGE 12411]MBE9034328.1 hypothetical protein [aff. Roholtiella sp. LEGE 12411]
MVNFPAVGVFGELSVAIAVLFAICRRHYLDGCSSHNVAYGRTLPEQLLRFADMNPIPQQFIIGGDSLLIAQWNSMYLFFA